MSPWSLHHAPGTLVGFADEHLIALVDLPTDDELVTRIASIMTSQAPTLDAVLDVLVSRGLRAVETFGLAERSAEGVRVLVRGACRADAADHHAEAGTGGLWVESTWAGVSDLRLAIPDADPRTLPLAGGMVLASAVGFGAAPVPVEPVADAPAPTDEPEPQAEPVPDIVDQPVTEEPAIDEPATDEPVLAVAPDLDDVDPDVPAPAPPADEQVAERAGSTMASPMTAPVPDEDDEAETIASEADQGIIAGLPWTFDDEMAPPLPAAPPQDDQPGVGHTTDVAALRAAVSGSDTMVVGVLCPDGHANPVHATACRICATGLAAQQPVELPRPSLGVLRLANGDVVALERGAVLGRNPRLPQGWTGEQPHLVRIDDPERDVSSQHLEVRLDAWHVLVRDLGSTNGTEVTMPGSEPVLLRAHEQLSIEPGTRIVLAGVFEVTYEAHA